VSSIEIAEAPLYLHEALVILYNYSISLVLLRMALSDMDLRQLGWVPAGPTRDIYTILVVLPQLVRIEGAGGTLYLNGISIERLAYAVPLNNDLGGIV